ncbi:MAG TPA: glycosyltransferase family 2 protein [Vicinamibacterales bacterium]|nr:glycosyltransferase family 2 protein [Vicinamibacterales bacterium]
MDVSVVIPTRNRSALLAMTLRSVLRQQSVDLEVIVVDEGSTDDTASMLAAVADTRLRIIRHDTPHGLSAARNHGANEARGQWLAFVDDDDLWAPDRLVRQIEAAEQAERGWVYTGSVNIEGWRIVYSRPPLPPHETVATLPRYNVIPGGGSNVMWRRSMWMNVGPFDTRFRGGEDWEMSIRSAQYGPPAWVCRPLMAKRVHETNMFLNVSEIMRATRLIEDLHHTHVDWGKVHRWVAERYLRNGQRGAALAQFAKAAMKGEVGGVTEDLSRLLRRRLGRYAAVSPPRIAAMSDPWAAEATAWLSELQTICSPGHSATQRAHAK